MIRSFLALVSLALLSPVAVAQLPPSQFAPMSSTCPGGVCPRVQSAVQTVRAAGADILHAAGSVVGGPVYGGQPAFRPMVTAAPVVQYQPAPMPMAPPPERFVSFSPPFLQRLGVRRIDVVFGAPVGLRAVRPVRVAR